MKANSDKSKQSKKATRRVLAGVLCGASVLSLVLSLVMPPISQAIANDAQTVSTEETVMGGGSSSESTDVENTNNGDTEKLNSDEAENDASEDTVAADSTADGSEVKGAEQPSDAQPSDNENSDENAIAPVSAEGYKEVKGNVAHAFDSGGKYRLSDKSWSDSQITITADTTIDLNGNMLYHGPGSVESFIVVQNGVTLTIEDSSANVNDATSSVTNNPGQLANMAWTNDAPQSLTYYETTSAPKPDGLGTTETTTQHTVSGFGAIVAASDSGSVKQVISVADGGTLNLNGGMITTPRDLTGDGHIIFAEGKSNETHVNINGGFITGANLNHQRGGWGGGLCVVGAKVTVNMTRGVIAANKAAAGGGIYAEDATLNLSGGVISGNATYANEINNGDNTGNGGYGGGVYTKGSTVTISGSACITNNRADARITSSNLYNNGLLGGGGIACTNGGKLTMTGGSVTANYSHEAGGGIYAGFYNQGINFTMSGGFIAGNTSDNAEGGGLRISSGTTGVIEAASASNKVYITNNKTMTGSTTGRGGDWGGGGVFVQTAGTLNLRMALITKNDAGGWGGGIGACPTGQTIVTHTNGSAIYANTDHGEHSSAGGNGKNEDSQSEYITETFKKAGHEDFFLVRKNDSQQTVAAVLGKMLGNGSAGWKGTCDGEEISIDPNGGAEAKYMFGLKANPTDDAKIAANNAATTVISGNYSYTHGGGIMTNGNLIVGEVGKDTSLDVYPAIKVKANKVLMKDGEAQRLAGHGYRFKLLGKADGSGEEPYWDANDTLQASGCVATPEFTVNNEGKTGEIVIDTAAYQPGNYDLYLVEIPIDEDGTIFDETIYKIHVKVSDTPVKINLMGININRYVLDTGASEVSVKKRGDNDFRECNKPGFCNWTGDSADSAVSTVTIGNDSNPAFTNELRTSGSWAPQVTKKVDGGEMKAFSFELANEDDPNFKKPETATIDLANPTDENDNVRTVDFKPKTYELENLKNGSNTFTYYVREKEESSTYPHYTFDRSVYKLTVYAEDNGSGKITTSATYTKIIDAKGDEIAEADQKPHKYGEDASAGQSLPTFTNTYSTSLPLSGMSGVTLTYLAGAAVLCAAAAWMHIRRKANAKGGKRRE